MVLLTGFESGALSASRGQRGRRHLRHGRADRWILREEATGRPIAHRAECAEPERRFVISVPFPLGILFGVFGLIGFLAWVSRSGRGLGCAGQRAKSASPEENGVKSGASSDVKMAVMPVDERVLRRLASSSGGSNSKNDAWTTSGPWCLSLVPKWPGRH